MMTVCLVAFFSSTGCAGVQGNKYNPYVQAHLPRAEVSSESLALLGAMGARPSTIQEEASHRKTWKEEVYPVVFGNRKSANEVLVFLDYAAPDSERVWQEVVRASRQLNARTSKIVVFGNSKEKYGTELMGGGIWMVWNRPEQAMEYYTYTLNRWNSVKARQRQQGRVKPFTYEYDATAMPTDQPILYTYLGTLRPPVPGKSQVEMVRYSYDAGSVNMFQAVSAARDYGVKSLPAVVVNDVLISNPTAEKIVSAAKR